MYRLTLLVLIGFVLEASILGFIGVLGYSGWSILGSFCVLLVVSWITNKLFSIIIKVPTNLESVYISALILTLIISPMRQLTDIQILVAAAFLTNASKYLITFRKSHVFNPVAIGVFLTMFILGRSTSWWVGTMVMLPSVIIGGILIVRKLNKVEVFLGFAIASITTMLILNFRSATQLTLLDATWWFFVSIMLIEPLTTPATRIRRLIYGALVGVLYALPRHAGPEVPLIIGNIFSYLVSPKSKWLLTLREKIEIAPHMFDFLFSSDRTINFTPGQYMELTLTQNKPDSRGSRRYLTIASSPTENDIRFGVKFYEHGSSFKSQLLNMQPGDQLMAGQLAGDFSLPKDSQKKLVFMAGGIGITPFRSMTKYLIDSNESRDIVLLYSNKNVSEIAYKDVFEAGSKIGLTSRYINTESDGRINKSMIQQITDYKQRLFCLSGPHNMVKSFEQILKELGIPKSQIIVDFFPGYA